MASNRTLFCVSALRCTARPARLPLSRTVPRRLNSTHDVPPPPLLQKLKGDLKSAMRTKDSPRLSVLRSVLSATLNASKTATPVKTDAQLVALLRKTQRASLDAASEFKAGGREDLATKEEEQATIMGEYIAASGIQVIGEAELRKMVEVAVKESKSAGVTAKGLVGEAMKRLSIRLEGMDVDRKELVEMVKEVVGSS